MQQFLDELHLLTPLFRGHTDDVTVGELANGFQQTAGIKCTHIQFSIVDLHTPDILVLVVAEAGAQTRDTTLGEHFRGIAHNQGHILIFVHGIQADRLAQVGVDKAAVHTAQRPISRITGFVKEDAL